MGHMQICADIIRRCVFKPYRDGATFRLTMWDSHRLDSRGQTIIGYRLTKSHGGTGIIFEAEDFSSGSGQPIDSDATVAALMGFLTLRPGDTDPDYFANYTREQLDFCATDAESLAMEVTARFGEEC